MKRTNSPVRHLSWFARDVIRLPGSLYLLVALIVGFIFWRVSLNQHGSPQLAAELLQTQIWNTCFTAAALFAIGGVVGIDLNRGYYRSLFSKPMAAWWYYLQRFLLGAAIVMVAPLLLGIAIDIPLRTGLGITNHLMVTAALGYLLIASASLLISNYMAAGWLVVFVMSVAQNLMGRMIPQLAVMKQDVPAFVIWLHRLLPPFDLIRFSGPDLTTGELTHVLLYGTGMLVAALLLLRFRPLGHGGRS